MPREEIQECTHTQYGGYDNPPDYCDNDAEPCTDPPRCVRHGETDEAWEYLEQNYYDDE